MKDNKTIINPSGTGSAAVRVLKCIGEIFPLRDVLFFCAYFLFVLHFIGPQLIFQNVKPFFSLRPGFFSGHMLYPGGPADYAALFIGQMLGLGWPGALAVTLEAWLLCRLTDAYFRCLFGRTIAIVRFAGPILLLLIACSYALPLGLPISVLIILGLGMLHARLPLKHLSGRLAVLALMSAAFCYLARPASTADMFLSYILLGCMVACTEISRSNGRSGLPGASLEVVVCLLSAVACYNYFSVPSATDYLRGIFAVKQIWTNALHMGMFMFVPICAGLTAGVICVWKLERKREVARLVQNMEFGRVFYWLLGTAALLCVSATLAFRAYAANFPTKKFLETRHYAENDMWREVLSAARQLPLNRFDNIVTADVNLALYHTGRLGEDMFEFPQDRQLLLDYLDVQDEERLDRISKLCLELGRFNDAEHTSYEALSLFGDHPAILKRLAIIHMAKDQPAISKVYLKSLSYDIVYGPWARSYLRKMKQDEHLGGDKFVQDLRRQQMADDDAAELIRVAVKGFYYFLDQLLMDSLKSGKQNRMAFEFMMANHLLFGELEKFADNLPLLKQMGYDHVPRLYQEAALIYMSVNKRPSVDTGGLMISPQTFERYERFSQILRQGGKDRSAVAPVLSRDGLSGSYFDYYSFGGVR